MATKKKAKHVPAAKRTRRNSLPLIVAFFALFTVIVSFVLVSKSTAPTTTEMATPQVETFDFGNQKVLLDGQVLNFVNGYFKSESQTYGDHTASIVSQTVNQAGDRGAAILIDNPGGSGTFYYLIGAMKHGDEDMYSDPMVLGDRVKVVSVQVNNPEERENGEIIVKYLDRASGATMADEPTVEITKQYSFEDNGNLIEVID